MKKFCIYCNKEIKQKKLIITDEDGSKKSIEIDLDTITIFQEDIGLSYICKDCKKC